MLTQQVQTALRVLFPPSCAGCGVAVDREFALCGSCWRELPLISGPICNSCGVPILADDGCDFAQCDDCRTIARPWTQGRAALVYRDIGRALVLRLKHGDRPDIAVTASTWMFKVAQPLLQDDTIIAPVPLHWRRLVRRRFNQAALLAQHVALKAGRPAVLDLLNRVTHTAPLDGVSADDRFARLQDVIAANPARVARIAQRHVLLVDDVMTSGATLGTAATACLAAGARQVDVLVLARVAKDA